MASEASSLRGRRLAIVIGADPARGDLDRAVDLAAAALRRGVEVGVFVMGPAVRGLPDRREALGALAEGGCDLVACATSAERQGLAPSDLGVASGTQDDHAALVHQADRVVAFT